MCCVMGYTGHDLSAAKFKEYLLRTVMRGPDDQRVVEGPFGLMGFGRLAIMGLTPEGMQPFYRGADCVVCNGELYGFRFEKEILKRRGYKFQSDCDCEILLPLYYEYGLDMFRHMDSEFALIMYDSRKDRLIAARDPIGIRPLFYGYSKSSHQIAFASEMQNLIGWCDDIRPFPIGSYYCDGRFVRYEDIADVPAPMQDDMDTVLRNIREKLIAGVEKRLDADAPVGFLLSGGLDSPVSSYMIARRGVELEMVHFVSPPYTSQQALDKVLELDSRFHTQIANAAQNPTAGHHHRVYHPADAAQPSGDHPQGAGQGRRGDRAVRRAAPPAAQRDRAQAGGRDRRYSAGSLHLLEEVSIQASCLP